MEIMKTWTAPSPGGKDITYEIYDEQARNDIATLENDVANKEASGTAETKVSNHNTDTEAHNDIRLLLTELITQVNSFLDVDDTTRDQLSEILRDIDANKTSIESIVSGKVNVTDIINNLTTNVANKPLSAAQGVVLKNLIDTLQTAVTSHTSNGNIHITAEERAAWNAKQPAGSYALQSEVDSLSEEIADKVDKTGITLGEHTDGLIYVFINGTPTGNGVEMGTTGDVVGIVDSDNNIVLTGELADGTYTIVYESADGEQTAIGGFTLGAVLELFVPSTCVLNKRLNSSGAESAQNSTFVTDYIDIGDLEPNGTRTILFSGFQIQMGRSSSPYTGIEVYDASKVRIAKGATEYNDPIEYDESGQKTFKATVNNASTSKTARYIRVYGHLGEDYATLAGNAIGSIDDLANCSLILG